MRAEAGKLLHFPRAHCGCAEARPLRAAELLSRRFMLSGIVGSFAAFGLPQRVRAQLAPVPQRSSRPIVFKNFRLFDGKTPALKTNLNLVVQGTKIRSLDANARPKGALAIDCKGRVVMPGLIDAHVHTIMESISIVEATTAPIGYVYAVAMRAAGQQLLRGFTSVRDMGGPSFGLKRAIDAGVCIGPRIFPSGAFISQTAGHGDFDLPNDVPRTPGQMGYAERMGMTAIADGVDAVLMRVREQLRQGASQIKMMAGGGVASNYDPLDVTQYTPEEFHAGVEAASAWGTYVAVHAYTPNAIKTALGAGVRCIEHGQLADDGTAQQIAARGAWWSLQPFLNDEDATPFPKDSANYVKQLQATSGTDTAYKLAKRHGAKTAFGTDILFDPRSAVRQGAQLAKLARWYSPAQILKMATFDNAALLQLSGPRSPYPGKLGAIEKDAYADLIVVDGDPLSDINLVADPEKNFVLIMKDGTIYKNVM
jgi:imidazolonepropionase-like amidohydrolase